MIARRLACVLVAVLLAAGLSAGSHGAASADWPGPLEGVVIALDPGHNGGNASHSGEISRLIWSGVAWKPCNTVGTTTVDGYPEHAYNWDVALRVEARLAALGATVYLTRTSDTGVGPCVDVRGRFGTEKGADLTVSIHGNGSSSTHRGFFVMRPGLVGGYTDDIVGSSATLAASLRTGLGGVGLPIANYYATDGLKTRTDLATFNFSDIPVAMVELGNMKNASDAARMKSASGRDRYADGLVAGIRLYMDQARAWRGAVSRLSGADRYATAAAVSRATFPRPPVPVVYVATGEDFPDALAGGPAAAADGGPVLLVTHDAIPPAVKTELARLQPLRITVLGGSAAVSDAVITQLHAYTNGSVSRLAGPDRYSTAANVVEHAFAGRTGPVYVASGGGFPDALSGGPVAAATGAPIVLATASGIPDSIMTAIGALNPTSFVLLGGPGVLGPGVADDLHARYPRVPVHRWSGPDRFATSAAISAAAFPVGATTVYLATGLRYPDALTGVPAAGLAGAPLLLARLDCLPQVVAVELRRLHPAKVVLLGGPGALAASAVTTVCGTVP